MQFTIKPVVTEKSMQAASKGKYTFIVPVSFTNNKIKEVIGNAFNVTVREVRTIKAKGTTRRNVYRKKITTTESKKAIVTLADKQTIALFGEEKSK